MPTLVTMSSPDLDNVEKLLEGIVLDSFLSHRDEADAESCKDEDPDVTTLHDVTRMDQDNDQDNDQDREQNLSETANDNKKRFQTLFEQRYESRMTRLMQDFSNEHPNVLIDFDSLSKEQQMKHVRTATAIWMRFQNINHNTNHSSYYNLTQTRNDKETTQTDNNSNNNNNNNNSNSQDVSIALLSPLTTSNHSHEKEMDDSSFVESVEQVRRRKESSSNHAVLFSTPDSTLRTCRPHKRWASTSATKGADKTRPRRNSQNVAPLLPSSDCGSSPPYHDMSSDMSSADMFLFTASQSPIGHDTTKLHLSNSFKLSPDNDDNDHHNNGSLQEIMTRKQSSQRFHSLHDTIPTMTSQEYHYYYRGGSAVHVQQRPVHVSLKESATFSIKPLQVQQGGTTNKRGECFADPLAKYQVKDQRRLTTVLQWMREREKGKPFPSGVVFFMPLAQTAHVILTLVWNQPPPAWHSTQLRGSTLMVTRSKQQLQLFASAFREGSALSVLNHADLPLSDRTRSKNATMCCNFNVVLSTFDALMSKDVAVALDENGHVVVGQDKDDGWLSSRSCSTQEVDAIHVEKFSILHLIEWQRVIYVDQLGRKSYLAKSGTLRAKAATALNADSRFACFEPFEMKESQWEALKLSDRNAYQSLAAILRLPEGEVYNNSIDLRNSRKL
jgi:hypothetical protein